MAGKLTNNAMDSEIVFGVGSWMVCSMGMLIFNKQAITSFPLEGTLTALQMFFSVLALLCLAFRSIHIGSRKDALRWSMVAPFFSGMLLTSILALKNAPMTLVIVFRSLSPLISVLIEQFYPEPLKITPKLVGTIAVMVGGAALYVSQMDRSNMVGVQWVTLNMLFAIADRLLQRLMLAKDQNPVDISKTGVTLLNNALGMVPLFFVALCTGELAKAPATFAALSTAGWFWVGMSCVVGLGISYTGIWAQSLISATSFLVLVNANKFFIIFIEAYLMRTKGVLTPRQVLGATISIAGGIAYALVRQRIEQDAAEQGERQKLIQEPAEVKPNEEDSTMKAGP
eukprot:TRINITY_DN6345_c0_g2_i1.p1 TRINITY_DN6345_c0_g2~~TRINITY_DN6345_c0_g2_i1.p1  ORF type:complete len:363 (-),score=59.84 TRINITY_DN6345_c0_g2_i1:41-1063(-)